MTLKSLTNPISGTSSGIAYSQNWNDAIDHIKRTPASNITISVQGSNYVAQKADGTELYNGTNADTCISTALAQTGHIHIRGGVYTLPSSFAGWNVLTNTQLTLDVDAQIVIPNNSTAVVFTLTNPCTQVFIDGGYFYEAGGSPQRKWTWCQLYGHNGGVYFCRISNSKVYDANIGLDLFIDTNTGWINSNNFTYLKMFNPNVGYNFNYTASFVADGSTGFLQNHFENCTVQIIAGNTLYGFKKISHWRNVFVNCYVWDPVPATTTATIDTNAQNTYIIGGNLKQQNYTDTSTAKTTFLLDATAGSLNLGKNFLVLDSAALQDDGSTILKVRSADLSNPHDISYQSAWVSPNSKISVNGTQWVFWDNTNQRIEFDKPLYFNTGVNPMAKSAATDPSTSDIVSGQYQVWKNTNTGAVKLWYNDGGSLKSVTLT